MTQKLIFLLLLAWAVPCVRAQSDTALEAAIHKTLHDSLFRNVDVSVQNSIVTLTGSVDLYQTKSAAEASVSRVRGVGLIRNQIQVAGGVVPDRKLEKSVEAAMAYSEFQQYGYLPRPGQGVLVRVQNGIVTLMGAVPGPGLASRLWAAAARTKGVRSIVDRMQVGPGSR
jgi:osmotically-inducible protein OsmY